MSLKQKVYKGFVWTGLQGASSQLISFVVFLVLARLLEPESFGLVAMATVVIAFLKVFSYFGLGTAVIQRKTLEAEHLNTAFWVDVIAGFVMMLATILLAGWFSEIYGEARLEPIIQCLSLLFIMTALSQIQVSLLRRNLEFKTLALRTLVGEVTGGAVGVALAFSGYGVWSLVFRQLTTSLIGLTILWFMSDWRPGPSSSFKHFKDLFSFSINMMGANIVDFFSRRSDSFLIGYFLGPVALGYYTVAYRLIHLLVEFLGGTVNKVVWPAFAKLQDDLAKLKTKFYSTSNLHGFIVFPVYLGILSISVELVPLMFGSQWQESVPILQILVFIGIISSISKLYDTVFVSLGRSGIWLCLKAAIAVTNVVAFLIAIQWGIIGVAIAYTVVGYLYFPIYLYLLRRIAGINILRYLQGLSASFFSSLVMLGVVFGFKHFIGSFDNHHLTLLTFIATGGLTYLLLMVIVSPETIKQLREVLNSVLPKRTRISE